MADVYSPSSFYGQKGVTPQKQLDFDARFKKSEQNLEDANEAAQSALNSAAEAQGYLGTVQAEAAASEARINAKADDAIQRVTDNANTAVSQVSALVNTATADANRAEAAKAAAVVAEGNSKASENAAASSSSSASQAKAGAEQARDAAQLALTNANTARDAAKAAQTGAEAARDTAVQAAQDAQTFVPANYVPVAAKGAANGVATLDSNGKLQTTQVPAIAITSVYSCTTLAARDAITAEEGDVAIVDDDGTGNPRSYIWGGYAWKELKSALTVLSVAGKTGNVSLSVGDVSGAAALAGNNTYTGAQTYRGVTSGKTSVVLQPNHDATHTGYLEFYTSDETRRAYLGFGDGSNRVTLTGDNGWGINLGGASVTVNGNVIHHAGNFTPGNYAALAGATFTGYARSKVQALTYGTTVTPDFNVANDFTLTLGGACAFANPSNLAVGQGGCIRVQQSSSGGVTPTFSGAQWKAAGTPQWNTAANGVSLMTYKVLVAGEVIYSVGRLA